MDDIVVKNCKSVAYPQEIEYIQMPPTRFGTRRARGILL